MNTDKRLNILNRDTSGHVMVRYFFIPLLVSILLLGFIGFILLKYEGFTAESLLILYSLIFLLISLGLCWRTWIKLRTRGTETSNHQSPRELELTETLRQRTTELEQANKDMNAFTYAISHDLRGALRSIRGYTELLQEDYGKTLDEDGLLYLSLISNTTGKVGTLIDDLVAFARVGKHEVQKAEVNMQALTEEVWNELNAGKIYTSRINILTLPEAYADMAMIKLVLLNVIANALKFTSKKTQSTIEVGAREEANELIYYIKDEGAGFNMKYAHKLFNLFERLHNVNEFEGTGVGLALVKRIILRHEGKVWAEGEEEQGACFYFSLPKK